VIRLRCQPPIILMGLLMLVSSSYAQLLGDFAREQRQKQHQSKQTPRKVITNEDLPARPESSPPAEDNPPEPKKKPETNSSQLSAEEMGKLGEKLKAQIRAQKDAVEEFQDRVDQLAASIHFVDPNAYVNGPQYNQHQLRRKQQLDQLRKVLAEQKKKLEDMQDSARRQGFGNSVYDP
jgi:predicted RNase H-like nuclease (RuvC/YqgF family)